MNMVKRKIAKNLFFALKEANFADCFDGPNVNDLSKENSRQADLYGNITDALISLGYKAEYLYWLSTGDIPDFGNYNEE